MRRSRHLWVCLLLDKHIEWCVKGGTWMAKLDLSDGFHHVPVLPSMCTLPGFRPPVSRDYYQYRYLTFGLRGSPFQFQSFQQQVQEVFRRRGIVASVTYV